MADDRLTIFDTTLRDGEQAPGFSLRIDEKLKMARQLAALGRGHHRGRVPDRVGGRRRGRAPDRDERRRSGDCRARALPPGRHRARRLGARRRRRARRIHIFIATSDLHLERKLRMSREACLEAAVAAVRQARDVHRRRAVLGGGRDAQRSGLPLPRRRGGHPRRRTTINLPDTVGYRHPDEIAAFFTAIVTRVPNARPGDLQHALPRRPRSGGRQHARRAHRRRAAGRVHDQRHRRARRQRVARRNGDGDARARRLACRSTTGDRHARDLRRRASCSPRSPARRCRPTRRSSAATRSRTKPAFTRTAC